MVVVVVAVAAAQARRTGYERFSGRYGGGVRSQYLRATTPIQPAMLLHGAHCSQGARIELQPGALHDGAINGLCYRSKQDIQ